MIQHLTNYEEAAKWLQSKTRGELSVDSRRLKVGDAFVAWPGYAQDARAYVNGAIEKGATACLVEQNGIDGFNKDWKTDLVASYSGLKAAGGFIADAYYEYPSQSVKVLAVTGTNGKTSIAWWLSAALSKLGSRCGVIGTLGVGEVKTSSVNETTEDLLNNFVANGLTTPDPLTLHYSLKKFKESGVNYCALEASSIGIVEHRLNGTKVHTAIFTNLSRDHLDYHESMEDYWSAKSSLFDSAELVCAVINVDDPKGHELSVRLTNKLANEENPKLKIIRVSEAGLGDFNATEISYPNRSGGLGFKVHYAEEGKNTQIALLETTLVGRYNVSNLLCVIATLCHLGYELQDVAKACADLPPVAGRMQRVTENSVTSPLVVVDYAHTPDALEKALQSLKPLKQNGGELYCLIGCGGNRDSGKRPLMAKVACKNADKIVFTSDNPRAEKAQSIVDDMLAGIKSLEKERVSVQLDRAKAIEQIIRQAKCGDIILLAGKGHEDYQEVDGVKTLFSDVAQAKKALLMIDSNLDVSAGLGVQNSSVGGRL